MVDTPARSGRQRFARLRDTRPAILPSLLLCDFAHLADEVHKLEDAGVAALHLDVMDGHFVPNLTYGFPIVEAVRRLTELPIEAHLMISDPQQYAEQFHAAGADIVTFHVEAMKDPGPLLQKLRGLGAAVGLAFNPGTPLASVEPYLSHCDVVLTMSVTAGFGGQEFNPVALANLRRLSALVSGNVLLEVDGGVNADTIADCAAAGAQSFVIGSAIFNHPDYSQTIARLARSAKIAQGAH